jgi:DNA topoisomerase-1
MFKSSKRAARSAGLKYISDDAPGISRHGRIGRFRYRNVIGRWIKDPATLKRIRKLAIPPAWTDVWVAPLANAHIQATGRDSRGRKQYRYHDNFAAVRDTAKYAHLKEFAAALPDLRRRLKWDMNLAGLSRDKVVATIVTLLQDTLIRVGNEDYARSNASFGLTTLRNRHVKVRGAELKFLFKGKSGKQWSLSITDRQVAKIVRGCQELPGQHLFEYLDEQGAFHTVSSSDVNAYLRAATGRDITAKDFRTWAGTVKAATAFHASKIRPAKKAVRDVIAGVAEELGNTATVCRKCYIHPDIVTAFEKGNLNLRIPRRRRNGLAPAEIAVVNFLRRPVVVTK